MNARQTASLRDSLLIRASAPEEPCHESTIGELMLLTTSGFLSDFADATLVDLADELMLVSNAINGDALSSLGRIADILHRLSRRASAASEISLRLREAARTQETEQRLVAAAE